MNDTHKVGIKDQILSATSISQVKSLLTAVKSYKHAHPSTVRKCERAAATMIRKLTR